MKFGYCLLMKAAEHRALLPVATKLCADLHSGSRRDQVRLQAAVHVTRLCKTLDSAGYLFTAQEVAKTYAAALAFSVQDLVRRICRTCRFGKFEWDVIGSSLSHHCLTYQRVLCLALH